MSKKQMGFTLIEIVMVLVLLGILSAVAVPKYFDLQEQALQNAAKATAAEFQSRLNARFASALLQQASCNNAKTVAVSGTTATPAVTGITGMSDALASDDFGQWTVALGTEADGKAPLSVTYDGVTYPKNTASAAEKAKFDIMMPLCQ